MLDWVAQVRENRLPPLEKMVATIMTHLISILVWYDCHISTAKVEGINNKIKVLKRNAYGFKRWHVSCQDYRRFTIAALLEMFDEPNFIL